MPDVIVSAHGGRYRSQRSNELQIPVGSGIVFYIGDGDILQNHLGYLQLHFLRSGDTSRVSPVLTKTELAAGDYTYNYYCWHAPQFAKHCGLYNVGDGVNTPRFDDMTAYPLSNARRLSDLFAAHPNSTIHWLCCREVS